MRELSYRRHRFPPVVIQHAVWLYLRFTLSYRDVEDPLAERGLDISYETVRNWVLKFGPVIARRLRRCRPRPSTRWHLDEMVVRITLLHGSAAGRSQPPAPAVHVRRTYSGRPSSSMRLSEATAMATSVVCRPSVRERSASPITRL
jgi:hypothetical protein